MCRPSLAHVSIYNIQSNTKQYQATWRRGVCWTCGSEGAKESLSEGPSLPVRGSSRVHHLQYTPMALFSSHETAWPRFWRTARLGGSGHMPAGLAVPLGCRAALAGLIIEVWTQCKCWKAAATCGERSWKCQRSSIGTRGGGSRAQQHMLDMLEPRAPLCRPHTVCFRPPHHSRAPPDSLGDLPAHFRS